MKNETVTDGIEGRNMHAKFFVPGESVAKGSTNSWLHPVTGALITLQGNAKKLYPWQQAIGYNALKHGVYLTEGGVNLKLTFFLKRPKKPKNPFPSRPDLDKLVRSCLDSLSGIAYRDDRQVVSIEAQKLYEADFGVGVHIEITHATPLSVKIMARTGQARNGKTRCR